jgi:hypothetical protein
MVIWGAIANGLAYGDCGLGAESNGRFRVAVKFENRKTVAPQLRDEFRTYRLLNEHIRSHQNSLHQHRLSDGKQLYGGVPNVYYFGQEGLYNCLVMDLLGPSMEELFDQCGRKFAVPTVCFAAVQMVFWARKRVCIGVCSVCVDIFD